MLTEEVTIGIYPDGELTNILIVPDGKEYHLFLTGDTGNHSAIQKAEDLGSIVIVNNDWMYEGTKLDHNSQIEIANYIMSYPADDMEL